jgi:hypothetical protein
VRDIVAIAGMVLVAAVVTAAFGHFIGSNAIDWLDAVVFP